MAMQSEDLTREGAAYREIDAERPATGDRRCSTCRFWRTDRYGPSGVGVRASQLEDESLDVPWTTYDAGDLADLAAECLRAWYHGTGCEGWEPRGD